MSRFRMLLFIGVLVAAVLAVSGSTANAAKSAKDGRFVQVPATALAAVEQLGLTPQVALDYGSFQWYQLSAADYSALAASGLPFTEDTTAGQVRVMGYHFDPIADGEPAVAAHMRAPEGGQGFYLVQLVGPTKDEWLTALQASGLTVLQYYPHHTYLVWGSAAQLQTAENNSFVRWAGAFHPAYKMNSDLAEKNGRISNVDIMFYDDGNLKDTLQTIQNLGGNIIQYYPSQPDKAFYDAIVEFDAARFENLAQIGTVLWFGYSHPEPVLDDEMSSQIVAGNHPGGVPVVGYQAHLASLGVTGAGVRWAIVDTGVDYDHPDLGPHIVGGFDFPGACSVAGEPGSDCPGGGHGTHVAGIVGGDATGGFADPSGFLYGLGIAPAYDIFAMNSLSAAAWPPAGGWQEHSKQAVLGQAIGGNNSWTTGEGTAHGYQASERTHDLMVRDGNFDTTNVAEPFIEVFSAGNSGPGAFTLTAPKEAKNLIIIASSVNFRVGNIDTISSFSSRGPAVDGRYVPTVAAPGEQIASSRNDDGGSCSTPISGTNNLYAFCSGTSMAAPQASGAVVLITEWWRGLNSGANPSPAMAKALLVNGAVDMGTADIPNPNEGWGRINVTNVISPSALVIHRDQLDVFGSTGDSFEITVGVPDPSEPLKVTIAWTDAPGAVGANPALVNNLNLTVVNGGNTYLGNVFTSGWSNTGGTADNLNNLENVYIQNPGSNATITISAANISGDGIPYNADPTDQDFVLVCYNCALGADFTLSSTPTSQAICAPDEAVYDITVGSILGYSDNVTLSVVDNPAGTTADFSVNPVTPPGNSLLTIGNTGAASAGSYTMSVVGIAPTSTHTITVGLDLYTAAPGATTLTAPADGSTNVPITPAFTWSDVADATGYLLEIAADAGFNTVVYTATTTTPDHTVPAPDALQYNTTYYWRVTAENLCGSTQSVTFDFTTVDTPSNFCNTPALAIVDNATVSDSMPLPVSGNILDINLSINAAHSWVGDTTFVLQHVDTGTTVTVIDRPGYSGTGFGCSSDNIDVLLDDEGVDGPVENQCATSPALFGNPTPNNPLSAFDGEDLSGTWTLSVTDSAGGDTGMLNEWCLVPTYEVVANYGVDVGGDAATSAPAGTTVTYTVSITNTGDVTDTFDLSAGGTWTTTASAISVTLLAGENTNVSIEVEIPASAANGDSDTATVTAVSQGDNGVSDEAVLTTTAIADEYSVVLSNSFVVSGTAGSTVMAHIWITNTGTTTDTFDISASGTWTVTVDPTSITLAAGEVDMIMVHITIPASAAVGDMDMVTVTATSQGDPLASDTSDGMVHVVDSSALPYQIYLPIALNSEN